MTLDHTLKEMATGKNFAALTTLLPDGTPMTHVMWVHADDEHLTINTEAQRQKFRNVERDPRVTVTVFNGDNPYQYVEARGHVVETIGGDPARADIDELSQKYEGTPYQGQIGPGGRVILRIAVDKVHKNNI